MVAEGLTEVVVGSSNFHKRVTEGVRAWLKHEASDGMPSRNEPLHRLCSTLAPLAIRRWRRPQRS